MLEVLDGVVVALDHHAVEHGSLDIVRWLPPFPFGAQRLYLGGFVDGCARPHHALMRGSLDVARWSRPCPFGSQR